MSLRDGPFGDLRVPLTWTAGLAIVLAVVAAIAFLVLDHRETGRPSALDPVRRTADGILQPVSSVVSAPVGWVRGATDFIGSYWNAAGENRRLRAEVAELRQTRDMAVALRATNQRYEALLGLRTDPEVPMITARSISDSRGPFANTRLADAGADRGVDIGFPVLNERGLVGRVVGVGPRVSRILLLTDIASRTPVMVTRTNARAVLTGDGGPNPRLSYLRTRFPLRAGDVIVTSGDGGLFPRGLTVGVAVQGMDGAWRVGLASDAAPVDFVKIMLFRDFAQVLGTGRIAATTMPGTRTEDPRARVSATTVIAPPPSPTAAAAAAAPAVPPPRPVAPAVRPTPATPAAARPGAANSAAAEDEIEGDPPPPTNLAPPPRPRPAAAQRPAAARPAAARPAAARPRADRQRPTITAPRPSRPATTSPSSPTSNAPPF